MNHLQAAVEQNCDLFGPLKIPEHLQHQHHLGCLITGPQNSSDLPQTGSVTVLPAFGHFGRRHHNHLEKKINAKNKILI